MVLFRRLRFACHVVGLVLLRLAVASFDFALSWAWSVDPAPLVSREQSFEHRAKERRNLTRSASRSFQTTGLYFGTVAA